MKSKLRHCGSAHCKKAVHIWIDEGTPYARLSAANCGAQPDRTEEQLRQSDERLKANIERILTEAST